MVVEEGMSDNWKTEITNGKCDILRKPIWNKIFIFNDAKVENVY